MDVNSFLGALAKPPEVNPVQIRGVAPANVGPTTAGRRAARPAAAGTTSTGESREEPVSPPAPVVSPVAAEAAVVISDTTPSGIVVEYEAKPKRLYRVNGVEVPSVTTVLNCLDKPALPWWGMKVGVQGVIDLFDLGALSSAFDWDVDKERLVVNDVPGVALGGYATAEAVVDLLKEHRLTVNHVRDKAGDRGNTVHSALEDWARVGKMPMPSDFDESEQGYVKGLVGFLNDLNPEPARCEVMVGSAEHGFAGRYDLVIRTNQEREYTSRYFLKRDDKREQFPVGEFLVDLKTSSGVYASHHRQLAAYEGASVECGYPATDGRYVLHVGAEGKYELVKSTASFEDFLVVLNVWKSDDRMRAA